VSEYRNGSGISYSRPNWEWLHRPDRRHSGNTGGPINLAPWRCSWWRFFCGRRSPEQRCPLDMDQSGWVHHPRSRRKMACSRCASLAATQVRRDISTVKEVAVGASGRMRDGACELPVAGCRGLVAWRARDARARQRDAQPAARATKRNASEFMQ